MKKYAVLFESSTNGLPRIELYDSKDTYEKKESISGTLKRVKLLTFILYPAQYLLLNTGRLLN